MRYDKLVEMMKTLSRERFEESTNLLPSRRLGHRRAKLKRKLAEEVSVTPNQKTKQTQQTGKTDTGGDVTVTINPVVSGTNNQSR